MNLDKKKAIGTFCVQLAGDLCAYDLPGGSIDIYPCHQRLDRNDIPQRPRRRQPHSPPELSSGLRYIG